MPENNNRAAMASTTFFILSFLAIVFALFTTLDVFQPLRDIVNSYLPLNTDVPASRGRTFTKDELARFTGAHNSDIYLAILGEVFDVTKGRRHYGEGGGYNFFAGKDGTRAFVSGDFTEKGLIEDTTGLSHTDILGIVEWKQFYNKDYKNIGKVIGHYYDERGRPTTALREFNLRLAEAEKSKQSDEDDKVRFPPCNAEFRQGAGRRIWCSTLSGGVQRQWVGVPRQYFQPGKTEPRCACVKDYGAPSGTNSGAENDNRGDLDNQQMKLYEGCDPKSFECRFKE